MNATRPTCRPVRVNRRLGSLAAAVLIALGLGTPWTLAADSSTSPVILDSRHQLFLDDHLIASSTRVKRVIEPAQKFPGNPVLWPAERWEPPMATVYGSVLRDGDGFKMWYKSGMGVAYAESDDGIRWRKPRLGFVRVNGERSNLLFTKKSKTEGPDEMPYFYELFGVHRDDRDPDPARRYKMGFLCIDWKYEGADGDPWHKGQRRGLGVAASPDGLHWKLLESWATEAIVDGATHWLWEPTRHRYVLYGRTRKSLPGVVAAWQTNHWFQNWFSGRAVARVELRFYYGGRMYRHGPYQGPDKGPEKSGIGFATIRRDRFVALEASFDGGQLVTRPVRLTSAALRLNAQSDFGEILVEVLADDGRVLARSAPIQRDGLDLPVEWREAFQPPATPVTLRFHLTNARLFAIWCE